MVPSIVVENAAFQRGQLTGSVSDLQQFLKSRTAATNVSAALCTVSQPVSPCLALRGGGWKSGGILHGTSHSIPRKHQTESQQSEDTTQNSGKRTNAAHARETSIQSEDGVDGDGNAEEHSEQDRVAEAFGEELLAGRGEAVGGSVLGGGRAAHAVEADAEKAAAAAEQEKLKKRPKKRSRNRQLRINMRRDKRPASLRPKPVTNLTGNVTSDGLGHRSSAVRGREGGEGGGGRRSDVEPEAVEGLEDLEPMSEIRGINASKFFSGGSNESLILRARFNRLRKSFIRSELPPARLRHELRKYQEREAEEERELARRRAREGDKVDWDLLGETLALDETNRTVSKLEETMAPTADGLGRPVGTFALWGAGQTHVNCSRWGVRVNTKDSDGSLYTGVLLVPFSPPNANGEDLRSKAWMLASDGFVYRTGRAGKEVLNFRKSFKLPDPRSLQIEEGDIVVITLNRTTETLSVQVNDRAPAVIRGVSPSARPFVNLARTGDSATIVPGSRIDAEIRRIKHTRKMQRAPQGSKHATRQARKLRGREANAAYETLVGEVKEAMKADLGTKALPEIDKSIHRNSLFEDHSQSDIPDVQAPAMPPIKVK